MKNLLTLLAICSLMACNQNTKKEMVTGSEQQTTPVKAVESKSLASGDYSSLLNEYSCDMTAAEIAEVLNVREGAIKLNLQDFNTKCYAQLSGFGDGATTLSWGTVPSSKKANKKAIAGYLKDKENNEAVMGMDIVLAATGDCYITYQPLHGRLLIYNENYEKAFLLSYGSRNNRGRTEEQHKELQQKMTDLANYLLKKHRK